MHLYCLYVQILQRRFNNAWEGTKEMEGTKEITMQKRMKGLARALRRLYRNATLRRHEVGVTNLLLALVAKTFYEPRLCGR